MKLNHEQLHRLTMRLHTRKTIAPTLADTPIITTVGALHHAVKEYGQLAKLYQETLRPNKAKVEPWKTKKYGSSTKAARGGDPTVHTAAYPAAFKRAVIAELHEPGINYSELARHYGISNRTLHRWREESGLK